MGDMFELKCDSVLVQSYKKTKWIFNDCPLPKSLNTAHNAVLIKSLNSNHSGTYTCFGNRWKKTPQYFISFAKLRVYGKLLYNIMRV